MVTTAGSIGSPSADRLNWSLLWFALPVVIGGMIFLFFDTAYSIYDIWTASDNYTHGFLIAPISLWLIWEKRAGLLDSRPVPTMTPVLLMIPVGLFWLLGYMTDVLVVQQYAFVGLLILSIWALIGTPVARYLAFPIGFLLLAVRVGWGLTYPMMNFTADFTVGALRLTGVPVFRDGTFFSIPSGDWSVVEACSGMRYLLASVTLGMLYAYLTYAKLWKRLIFIGFAFLVPVIANGIRAYLIVMIAHLSDMKLATGIDHFIYGWVFFGFIITIMFAIGAIWRDPPGGDQAVVMGSASGSVRSLLLVSISVLVVSALYSAAGWSTQVPATIEPAKPRVPPVLGDWRMEKENLWNWRPRVVGTDGRLFRFYRSGRGAVSLFIGVYRYQRDGSEAASVVNQIIPQEHPEWSDKEITKRMVSSPKGELSVYQHRLSSIRGEKLLVWHWYRVGDFATTNPFLAKFVELGDRISGGPSHAAFIAVAAPYRSSPEEAVPVLEAFLAASLPAIDSGIDESVAAAP